MGCSIIGSNGKTGPLVVDGKDSGLILNHAYSLNDILEMKDPFNNDQTVKLLRLRNPWGDSEWKGAWSDKSEEMKKYRESVLAYIKTLPPDEQFDPSANDGTFLMHFDDWKDIFSTVFLNLDFPEAWTGVRFRSKWTKSNSGGLPREYSQLMLERFAKNPQFLVAPAEDCEIMFSLA